MDHGQLKITRRSGAVLRKPARSFDARYQDLVQNDVLDQLADTTQGHSVLGYISVVHTVGAVRDGELSSDGTSVLAVQELTGIL